ncbi:MAG: hypothetical protein GY830_08595 [Bacteroidetes bacterium]|nr:hypothetical protein [Bacteroidota bacterium]
MIFKIQLFTNKNNLMVFYLVFNFLIISCSQTKPIMDMNNGKNKKIESRKKTYYKHYNKTKGNYSFNSLKTITGLLFSYFINTAECYSNIIENNFERANSTRGRKILQYGNSLIIIGETDLGITDLNFTNTFLLDNTNGSVGIQTLTDYNNCPADVALFSKNDGIEDENSILIMANENKNGATSKIKLTNYGLDSKNFLWTKYLFSDKNIKGNALYKNALIPNEVNIGGYYETNNKLKSSLFITYDISNYGSYITKKSFLVENKTNNEVHSIINYNDYKLLSGTIKINNFNNLFISEMKGEEFETYVIPGYGIQENNFVKSVGNTVIGCSNWIDFNSTKNEILLYNANIEEKKSNWIKSIESTDNIFCNDLEIEEDNINIGGYSLKSNNTFVPILLHLDLDGNYNKGYHFNNYEKGQIDSISFKELKEILFTGFSNNSNLLYGEVNLNDHFEECDIRSFWANIRNLDNRNFTKINLKTKQGPLVYTNNYDSTIGRLIPQATCFAECKSMITSDPTLEPTLNPTTEEEEFDNNKYSNMNKDYTYFMYSLLTAFFVPSCLCTIVYVIKKKRDKILNASEYQNNQNEYNDLNNSEENEGLSDREEKQTEDTTNNKTNVISNTNEEEKDFEENSLSNVFMNENENKDAIVIMDNNLDKDEDSKEEKMENEKMKIRISPPKETSKKEDKGNITPPVFASIDNE